MSTAWTSPTLHVGGRARPTHVGPARENSTEGERIGPWPAFDGIRAIAVAAVVAYHLGTPWLPGGFLGVDMFFVLSGFLITSILLDEWLRTGQIRVRHFYVRRARRLLPALYLMLVSVVLVTGIVARFELGRLRGDVIAALAYVTNWTQIFWNQSYFAASGPPSLLEQLWSLAVEEQFYLIWPIVLVICLSRRRKNLALTLAMVGIAISTWLMWALYSPYHDPSRVYYGSDTHAAPILIGAALALVRMNMIRSGLSTGRRHRARRSSWPVDLLALCGAAVVAYFLIEVRYTESALYHGGFAMFSLATVLVLLAAMRTQSMTARLLSLSVLRWIGLRSYGIYLWHWPIIQLTQPDLHPPVHGLLLDVGRLALTVGAAALSYRFIERPIRTRGFLAVVRGGEHRILALARPAVSVLAIGVIVVVASVSLAGAKVTALAAGPRGDHGPRLTITIAPTATPTVAANLVQPSSIAPSASAAPPFAQPIRVGFFGDSQGMTLVAAEPSGLDGYLSLSDDTIEGCGILGGVLTAESGLSRDLDSDCGGWQRTWASNAERDHPQIAVIEIGAWEVFDVTVNGSKLSFGSSDWDAYFDQQLKAGIAELTGSGAQVALLSVPCYQPTTEGWSERGDRTRTDHLNTLLQQAAVADPQRVFYVQSAAQFCDDPDVVGNTDDRWDGTHFAGPGAAIEFQAITPQLLAIPQPPG